MELADFKRLMLQQEQKKRAEREIKDIPYLTRIFQKASRFLNYNDYEKMKLLKDDLFFKVGC